MSGDVHPNPGPATKYPCPVCTRNVTRRRVSYKYTKCHGWVHAKCSGILNGAQYRRKSLIVKDTGGFFHNLIIIETHLIYPDPV